MTAVVVVLLGIFLLSQVRGLVMTALGVIYSRRGPVPQPPDPTEWPSVLVQLPVYREERVLATLVSSVLALDYPPDRLAVQVIDDSDGSAAAVSATVVAGFQGGPVTVEYVRRGTRDGYKAGALNHGARLRAATLIAVFDADFVPDPRFLRETVPWFADSRLAAVQARWTYRNGNRSPLTMLQAALFETVFCFETFVRSHLGLPAFFMGTAGVWRRSAIEDLGGWRESPFTAEDLDLSYRALNQGWNIRYVHAALASCEASESFLSFKNQQRRWSRGIFQTLVDNWSGALHLRNGFGGLLVEASVLALQVCTPVLTLLLIVSAVVPIAQLQRTPGWIASEWVLSATLLLLPAAAQLIASQALLHRPWRPRAAKLLRASPLACGLSLAVIAGMWDVVRRSRGEFVRTPKQGGARVVRGTRAGWLRAGYGIAGAEAVLGAVGLAGLFASSLGGYWEAVVPTAALAAGHFGALAASLKEIRSEWAVDAPAAVT